MYFVFVLIILYSARVLFVLTVYVVFVDSLMCWFIDDCDCDNKVTYISLGILPMWSAIDRSGCSTSWSRTTSTGAMTCRHRRGDVLQLFDFAKNPMIAVFDGFGCKNALGGTPSVNVVDTGSPTFRWRQRRRRQLDSRTLQLEIIRTEMMVDVVFLYNDWCIMSSAAIWRRASGAT